MKKIKEMEKIQNDYFKKLNNYFNALEKELRTNLPEFTIEVEEVKTEADEIWAEYSLYYKDVHFMVDYELGYNGFRLAIYKQDNPINYSIIKEYNCLSDYDSIFNIYTISVNKDLKETVDILKDIKEFIDNIEK